MHHACECTFRQNEVQWLCFALNFERERALLVSSINSVTSTCLLYTKIKRMHTTFSASLEEQLQRISLDNINRRNSITLHSNQALPSVSSSSASETSASSSASTASTASASKSHHRPVTASQSKEIHLIQSLDPSTHNSLSTGEPIYAVVDLKNKYARRAQLREMEDIDLGKDRPNSVHVLSSSDYEEVLQLTTDCVDGREIDENIYEPVSDDAKQVCQRLFSLMRLTFSLPDQYSRRSRKGAFVALHIKD